MREGLSAARRVISATRSTSERRTVKAETSTPTNGGGQAVACCAERGGRFSRHGGSGDASDFSTCTLSIDLSGNVGRIDGSGARARRLGRVLHRLQSSPSPRRYNGSLPQQLRV